MLTYTIKETNKYMKTHKLRNTYINKNKCINKQNKQINKRKIHKYINKSHGET